MCYGVRVRRCVILVPGSLLEIVAESPCERRVDHFLPNIFVMERESWCCSACVAGEIECTHMAAQLKRIKSRGNKTHPIPPEAHMI